MRLLLPGGLEATVLEQSDDEPLATIRFNRCCTPLYDALYRIGQPVRYEYIRQPWDLEYYPTVFASVPGSVEMPSAGRAFSWELLLKLRQRGIGVAFLSLHAGLSYYLNDRWEKDPRHSPEEYLIPPETAAAIGRTKAAGRRIIAVGTTVVRALESAVDERGMVTASRGWADLFSLCERGEHVGAPLAFLSLGGGGMLELVQVGEMYPQEGVVNHIALAVADLDGELERLRAAGVTLLDEAPVPIYNGGRLAFAPTEV